MDLEQLVRNLWRDMDNKSWSKLPEYFSDTAAINWHNTNECFSVQDFVLVNSKYPGEWRITVKRLHSIGDIVISVAMVAPKNGGKSYHVTSFFEFSAGKIAVLDEYWGEDGNPPLWRPS